MAEAQGRRETEKGRRLMILGQIWSQKNRKTMKKMMTEM